jgi:hypothetical protein
MGFALIQYVSLETFQGGNMITPNFVPRMFLSSLTLLALSWSISVAQANELTIGEILIGGPGCSTRPPKVILAAQKMKLQYGAALLKYPNKGLARTSCSIVVPISVPSGQRLVLSEARTTGYGDVGAGSAARAAVEIFKPGMNRPAKLQEFPRLPKRQTKPIAIVESPVFASECGEAFNLRLNTNLLIASGEKVSTLRLSGTLLSYSLEECSADE